MSFPLHLLFPLFSSVVFVLGMLLGKRAITTGASPWTSTFLSNFWLAVGFVSVGCVKGDWLPTAYWWQAGVVGLLFVAGQVFLYLAFQYGDVSVATPLFGVKVIIVAALLALLAGEPIETRVWIGAALAAVGVGVMQSGARSTRHASVTWQKATASIVLALASAVAMSLFDVGLQVWGRKWGATLFLPATFACGGVASLVFLPWIDRPRRLRELSVAWPMVVGSLLIALQAMSMSYSLGRFGDATRINIVYALRGLWAVGLAWLLARLLQTPEAGLSSRTMLIRLLGALLLTASVIISLAG
ncbi:MAG: DMT family transporter [Pirellulales bacterium]